MEAVDLGLPPPFAYLRSHFYGMRCAGPAVDTKGMTIKRTILIGAAICAGASAYAHTADAATKDQRLPVTHPGLVKGIHWYFGEYRGYRWKMHKDWQHYNYAAEHTTSYAYGLWIADYWRHKTHKARLQYLAYAKAHRSHSVSGSPVDIGRALAAQRGWTGSQWSALYALWNRESGWDPNAYNSSSGACGIPQALPCSKITDHSTAGQIKWGMGYIAGRYGTPSAAWAHSQAYGWY